MPAPAAAPPSSGRRPRRSSRRRGGRQASRASVPTDTPSDARPSSRWRPRKSSARSSWKAVKYASASTGTGSISPVRGRRRKVAPAAAAAATRIASGSRERPIPRHCRRPPMRIALLSDVHGNLPAFEAVLADIESSDAEQIWCLGDLVGYGAQPDECVALARERCDALAGRQPRPGGHRGDPDLGLLVERRRRGALDPGGHLRGVAVVPAPGSPPPSPRASRASSTAARATRSGSTCSRAGRRTSAWT